MLGAAARKKRTTEADTDALETRGNGLWIDVSRLPTILALRGKKQELAGPLERWSGARRELPQSRFLAYADLVLGSKGRSSKRGPNGR